jgi:hypothetical protein
MNLKDDETGDTCAFCCGAIFVVPVSFGGLFALLDRVDFEKLNALGMLFYSLAFLFFFDFSVLVVVALIWEWIKGFRKSKNSS